MRNKLLPLLIALVITLVVNSRNLSAQEEGLVLYAHDVRITEIVPAGGFFLYIRNKKDISSVLLTESAEGPVRDVNTYALRTIRYNAYNGNERRVLNGRFIQPRDGYFIIDSTPEPDPIFGSAFVLFLPYQVQFGYKNTRNDIIDFRQENTYLSIRTFVEPYADYSGTYLDNSFYLERQENITDSDADAVAVPDPDVETITDSASVPDPDVETITDSASVPDLDTEPLPQVVAASPIQESIFEKEADSAVVDTFAELPDTRSPIDHNILNELFQNTTSKYSQATIESFTNIATNTNSLPLYAEDKTDIVHKIGMILSELPRAETVDIVVILDTTRSMFDDLSVLKSRLIPTISQILQGEVFRIGMVLYKDRNEDYITQKIDFNDQIDIVQRSLNKVHAGGGGDWPEAVYEGLNVAVNDFSWLGDKKIVFIVGDAPPHEPPNTSIDIQRLYNLIAERGITVYPIIVPRRE